MELQDASLDTSFWSIAAQIGVVPYLFAFFRVNYCTAVENKIVTTSPDRTPLVYPRQCFSQCRGGGQTCTYRAEPVAPIKSFGIGEAHAIALARERSWILLINDTRPMQFAQSLGIRSLRVGASVLCPALC